MIAESTAHTYVPPPTMPEKAQALKRILCPWA